MLPENLEWNEIGLVVEYGADVDAEKMCLVRIASLSHVFECVKLCSGELESECVSSRKTNLWIEQLR